MRNAVFGPRTYEETPGVERLGGIFSRFSAEGVGGGVAEEIVFHETALKNVVEWILNIEIIKILRICIDEIK
jgi:hypothetical protein